MVLATILTMVVRTLVLKIMMPLSNMTMVRVQMSSVLNWKRLFLLPLKKRMAWADVLTRRLPITMWKHTTTMGLVAMQIMVAQIHLQQTMTLQKSLMTALVLELDSI